MVALCPRHHQLVSEHKWSDLIYAHPNGEMHYNVKDENGLDKCDRAIGVWSAEARAYHDDLPLGAEGEPGIPETPQDTQETAPAVTISTDRPLVYVELPQDDPYEPVFHSPRVGIEDTTYGPTSLTLREGLSYERWEEIGGTLKSMEHGLRWWWGDWARYGERWGEKKEQAISMSGLSYGSVANCEVVSKTFEFSRRRENLDWSDHQAVAALPLEEQERLLDLAEADPKKWNRYKLRLEAKLSKQVAALALGSPPGKFHTIVIDPPWRYDNTASRGAAEDHYETLPIDELADFTVGERPVSQLAEANAHLYLWVPSVHLAEGDAAALARRWGFEPKCVLTWVKPQVGIGNWFRSASEHILFCVRGDLYLTVQEAVGTWFLASRGKHSEKPDEFYALVERVSPGPWLDLFARRRRDGWECWGDEVEDSPA